MSKNIIITVITAIFLSVLSLQAGVIGSWKTYLAHSNIQQIIPADNHIFVLSDNSLYSYNTADKSITTYDKSVQLSDHYITNIAWSKKAGKLVIIYADSNIDLMDIQGQVTNISSIYSKQMTENKTINSITIKDEYAYLSCGFGIIKLNLTRGEISDSYNLGVNIVNTVITADAIYANQYNRKGIWRVATTANLLDKNNWQKITSTSPTYIFNLNNTIVGIADNIISKLVSNNTVYSFSTVETYDFLFEQVAYSNDKVLIYGKNNNLIISDLQHINRISHNMPIFAYSGVQNQYYTSSKQGELVDVQIDNNKLTITSSGIKPEGPKYNYFNTMLFTNGQLYTTGGDWNDINETHRPGTVQVMDEDNNWTIYQDQIDTLIHQQYDDIRNIAVDPRDKDHVFVGGGGTGIFEFKLGKLVNNFTDDGLTPLGTAITDANGNKDLNYVRVDGLIFDTSGNLWMLNSESRSALVRFTADRKWESFNNPIFYSDNGKSWNTMRATIIDRDHRLWWVNRHWNQKMIYSFDPATKEAFSYNNFTNQDGITGNNIKAVNCIQQDIEGNIWIGTDQGPYLLPYTSYGNSNTTFEQVKVPRNDGTNYADYLLSSINITAIAIDGGGRKWFGTDGNGVYLISRDNMTQLQHFTSSNSSLLSDKIESIAINGNNGEVFFGTDMGLCSYISDATETSDEMTKDNVYAYPNPVKANYTGLITIVGLTLDADVKITTSNGILVAQGRSNGGTFTWDGRDQQGKHVASGIYMVHTATSDGNKGTVCKIAVIK